MTIKNNDTKKYAKLLGKVDYDHEAVEQLADALNEIRELKQRTSQLEQIVQENEDLHQFVWFTADGTTLPIHKIDDDHMENIMLHLLRTGRAIPRAIRGDAIQRGLTIPASVPVDWEDDTMRRLNSRLDRSDI